MIAQRLARRLCEGCKRPVQTTRAALENVGFPFELAREEPNFHEAVGCDRCAGTGGFPSGCAGGSPNAYDANGLATVTGCADLDFPGFTFDVTKQYLKAFKNAGAAQDFSFAPDQNNNGAVQVTVTVSWGNGKQYAVTGLNTR